MYTNRADSLKHRGEVDKLHTLLIGREREREEKERESESERESERERVRARENERERENVVCCARHGHDCWFDTKQICVVFHISCSYHIIVCSRLQMIVG